MNTRLEAGYNNEIIINGQKLTSIQSALVTEAIIGAREFGFQTEGFIEDELKIDIDTAEVEIRNF